MSKLLIKHFIPFIFVCFLYLVTHAQDNKKISSLNTVDSLKSILRTQKDDTSKIENLNKLCNTLRVLGKYDSALTCAKSIQALAEKINYKKGIEEAFKAMGLIYVNQADYITSLQYQLKSLAISRQINNKKDIASAYNNIGIVYMKQGNYAQALEYYYKSLNVSQEIKYNDGMCITLCNIGGIYSIQDNYSQALEYFNKALAMAREIKNDHGIALNLWNIGDIYNEQNKYDKAIEYYNEALDIYNKIGDRNDIAHQFNNIGNINEKQGNYTKALIYYSKAFSIEQEIGANDQVANLYSSLGGIYIKLKNYKLAKTLLDSALIFSKKIGNKGIIEKTYKELTTLDSITGNYKSNLVDYKQYVVYRDSLVNQQSMQKITQMELSNKFQKVEDSIKEEQERDNIVKTDQLNRKRVINNSLTVIIVLFIILTIVLINRQQINRKKDKLLFEKEANVMLLEKYKIESELKDTKAILDDYIKNLMTNNLLIEGYNTELNNIKNLKAKEINEHRFERIEQLNKATILTDEDWDKFKELFEQVYKGFFIRLKERQPNLTQAEIRLICLFKLKLEPKEMAKILGVSFDTIRISRYRLRKKLGLIEQENLYNVVDYI